MTDKSEKGFCSAGSWTTASPSPGRKKDILSLIGDIKNTRNDINHFGFQLNPLSSDKLTQKLQEYFKRFCDYSSFEAALLRRFP